MAETLRSQAYHPYLIPYGGSNTTGALGFVAAAAELKQQLNQLGETVDTIVFASSSGGTQAGLTVGSRIYNLKAQLIGIGIDKADFRETPFEQQLAHLANETATQLEVDANYTPPDFTVNPHYLGAGYGIVGDREREALTLMAQTEVILLDPVYSGRAFGGLADLIGNRVFQAGQTVLFWHTGGTPALFAYTEALTG